MKALIYFIITLITPILGLFLTDEIQGYSSLISIISVIFLIFFSYYIGYKEKLKTVKLYLYFIFILKILFDILILIIDNTLTLLDGTTIYLIVPILGSVLFGNILILIGTLLGLKKQGKKLEVTFLKRACFYVLTIIFAIMNIILNNYCGITGHFCYTNNIIFINTLLTIPLIELVFTIYYQEPYKVIKILILLLLLFIGCFLEILIINKTRYNNTCSCAYASNCTLKSKNTYECKFIGTDGETFCQIECHG